MTHSFGFTSTGSRHNIINGAQLLYDYDLIRPMIFSMQVFARDMEKNQNLIPWTKSSADHGSLFQWLVCTPQTTRKYPALFHRPEDLHPVDQVVVLVLAAVIDLVTTLTSATTGSEHKSLPTNRAIPTGRVDTKPHKYVQLTFYS